MGVNVQDLLKRLDEKCKEFSENDALFQMWLKSAGKFHRYSPNNMMLIWLQDPDATEVNSFKRWQELGRQVQKGEHSIRIIAPRIKKAQDENERDRLWFAAVPVFSYEQTEPIEGFENPWEPYQLPKLGDADIREPYDQLKVSLEADGVQVTECDMWSYPDSTNGSYDRQAKVIKVRDGRGSLDMFRTLIHEAAHCEHLLKHEEDIEHGHPFLEYVAEASAFGVLSSLGIDSSAASVPYVSVWKSHGVSEEQLVFGMQRVAYVIGKIMNRLLVHEETEAEAA